MRKMILLTGLLMSLSGGAAAQAQVSSPTAQAPTTCTSTLDADDPHYQCDAPQPKHKGFLARAWDAYKDALIEGNTNPAFAYRGSTDSTVRVTYRDSAGRHSQTYHIHTCC